MNVRLDEFLQQQMEGGQLNSSGHFTLDLSQARDKLQQYRLPAPEFYLLKLVQCASRLSAERIRFRLGQRETMVTFTIEEDPKFIDFKTLLDALADPYELDDGPLRHLIVGLAASLTLDPEEVCWLVRWGSKGMRVSIGEQIVTDTLDFDTAVEPSTARCTFYLRRPWTWRFWEPARLNAEALQLLSDRCRFAKLKVVVDGRNLQDGWNYERFAFQATWFKSFSQAYHLVEHFYLTESEPSFSFRRPFPHAYEQNEEGDQIWKPALWWRDHHQLPLSDTRAVLCKTYGIDREELPPSRLEARIEVNLALALPINLEGPGFVGLVKDSVLLGFNEAEVGLPGLVALLPFDGHKVDLTDFQVIQDEVYQTSLETVRRRGQKLLQEAVKYQRYFKPIGHDLSPVFNRQQFVILLEQKLRAIPGEAS